MEPGLEENEAEPRRGRGCLWGCLTLILVIGLVGAALFGYGVWFFNKGFENDARIQEIMAVVQNDPRAEMVLGRNIRIVERNMHIANFIDNRTRKATYTLKLAGSDGEGELKAYFDLSGPKDRLVLMVLTGTDGHPHYLVGKEPKNPFVKSI